MHYMIVVSLEMSDDPKMVDAVYELLAHIYHVGKNEWTDLLVKAVYYPDELVKEVPQES